MGNEQCGSTKDGNSLTRVYCLALLVMPTHWRNLVTLPRSQSSLEQFICFLTEMVHGHKLDLWPNADSGDTNLC